MLKGAAFHGDHLHDIGNGTAQFFDFFYDFRNMPVIDPFQHDDVYLAHDAAVLQHFYAGELVSQKDGRSGFSGIGYAHVVDFLINFAADFRIHRIDGDSDVGHAQFRQGVGVKGEQQAVCGQAEGHVRVLVPDQAQGLFCVSNSARASPGPAIPTTFRLDISAFTRKYFSKASSGVKSLVVIPGRLSLGQSNFLRQ